ncbi:aminoglycoside phosphotransferase family protein [Leifsonia sp. NPDC058248]|uniref:aminoglycoside phosphotransferase family protein n=1 Tax=Leifsonia sp. NPDC058248 TaxID=3346402 RepID=UPI0036DEC865
MSDRAGGPDVAALIAPRLTQWALTPDGPAFATASSVLQPVLFDGRAAYLKIATADEEAAGGRVMVWWDGRGAAPVYAHDGDALVLERATGRTDLAELATEGPDADDEATRILCRAALRLHAVDDRPLPDGLVDLTTWFSDLFAWEAEHPEAHDGLYPRAASEARRLLATPDGNAVLHGDVHHGNVLDFGADGWLAIDPKHIIGDPGFDFANILCNPDARVALSPGRLERHIGVIASETGIEADRMLRWTLAWAALSSCWSELSGDDPGHVLEVGRHARALLG